MRDVVVTCQDIDHQIENLNVRKAHGPDNISNWILKECKEELPDKIHDIIKCSLAEGKILKGWKKTNIVPIYKGEKRRSTKL